MTRKSKNTIGTTFCCEAVVRPQKEEGLLHEVAFGRVLVGDEWKLAYVPSSVVKRMQPRKGGTYDAEIVEGSNEVAKSGRYLVCRIEKPTAPVLSEAAVRGLLFHVSDLELTTARELTLKLCAEGHSVLECDVWITLQGLWREGRVSRLALTRDAASLDHATAWTSPDFEITSLLED